MSPQEDQLADLLIGEEQGALFWLLGSDSDALAHGNAAFAEVLEKHADHPLSDYVRLANGLNASRTFVTIDDQKPKRVKVRKAALSEAQGMLAAATQPSSRVDDISKLMILGRLERAQRRQNQTQAADATLTRIQAIKGTRR